MEHHKPKKMGFFIPGLIAAASAVGSLFKKSPAPTNNFGAFAGAGAGLLSQGINAIAQGANNRRNRDFAREQYATQRKDALSDFTALNEYNSPTAQMQRLREAGLNPNLVYGGGANAMGQPIRSSDSKMAPSSPAQFDAGSVIGSFMDIQRTNAQVDLLRQQKELLEQDRLLKIANTNVSNERAKQIWNDTYNSATRNEWWANKERDVTLEGLKLRNKKAEADIRFTNNQDNRAERALGSRLATELQQRLTMMQQRGESAARVMLIYQTITNMVTTGEINKQELIDLKNGFKNGSNTNAVNMLIRKAQNTLDKKAASDDIKSGGLIKGPFRMR